MTDSQVFDQKFTLMRRILAQKTHPFWPHTPNMSQYGSALPPPPRRLGEQCSRCYVYPYEKFEIAQNVQKNGLSM